MRITGVTYGKMKTPLKVNGNLETDEARVLSCSYSRLLKNTMEKRKWKTL